MSKRHEREFHRTRAEGEAFHGSASIPSIREDVAPPIHRIVSGSYLGALLTIREVPVNPSRNALELFEQYLERLETGNAEDLDEWIERHGELRSELAKLASEHASLFKPATEAAGHESEPSHSLSNPDLLDRLKARDDGTRYEDCGEVARGGMGAVLRVRDSDLNRYLAKKIILGSGRSSKDQPGEDPKMLARFLEEAQVTGQLDHPGIVPIHELGVDLEGRPYFTMKLVKGEDFSKIIERVHGNERSWTLVRALNVILKVCEAMNYAHAKGVIHRDLKPANIMVGRFEEVYVMDWGLARVLGQRDGYDLRIQDTPASTVLDTERQRERAGNPDTPLVTMDGTVLGTPSYMPPEQAKGELDDICAQSDVYSIGAILYHLLTEQPPYSKPGARATPRSILVQLLKQPPLPIDRVAPGIPAELIAIVKKAMDRTISKRYANTRQLAADIRAYLENRVVEAYRTGAAIELQKWFARNKIQAMGFALAILALIIGLLSSISFLQEARRNETRALDNERAVVEQAYVTSIRGVDAALSAGRIDEALRLLQDCPPQHRGIEWELLRFATDPSLQDLPGHEAPITSVDFSPDGEFLATSSEDGVTKVLRVTSFKEVQNNREVHAVTMTDFSPDGRSILIAVNDTVKVLNIRTLADEYASLKGHTETIVFASFRPDSGEIVTASLDGTIRIWDGGREKTSQRILAEDLSHAALSPDGQRIAWREGESGRVFIATLGANPSESSRTQVTDEPSYLRGSLRPDGGRFVEVYATGLRFADPRTGNDIATIPMETPPTALAFSPTGPYLVTGSADGSMRLWDANTLPSVTSIEHPVHGSANVGVDPTGSILSIADEWGWTELDLDSGFIREPATWTGFYSARSAAFAPTGDFLVIGGDDDAVRILSLEDGSERTLGTPVVDRDRTHLGTDEPIPAFGSSFSPNIIDSVGVSRSGEFVAAENTNHGVRVWNLSSGHPENPDGTMVGVRIARYLERSIQLVDFPRTHRIELPSDSEAKIEHVSFASDGSLTTAATSGEITRWKPPYESPASRVKVPGDAFEIDPSSQRIVARHWSHGVILLDAANGETLATLPIDERFESLSLTNQSHVETVWLGHDHVSVRDLATGRTKIRIPASNEEVTRVRISDDRSLVATASRDNRIRIWNDREDLIHTLTLHSDDVLDLAFSADTKLLASASEDDTVRVWSLENGNCIREFTDAADDVRAVRFADATNTIVATSSDGTMYKWNLSEPSLGPTRKQVEGRGRALSSQGTWLATVDEDRVLLHSFDRDEPVELPRTFEGVSTIDFSQDETTVAVSDAHAVSIWRCESKSLIREAPALAGSSVLLVTTNAGGILGVREEEGGMLVARCEGISEARGPVHLGYSANPYLGDVTFLDDERLAMSLGVGATLIWDWRTDSRMYFPIESESLAASEDGQLLATVSSGIVRVYDVASMRRLHSFGGRTGMLPTSHSTAGRRFALAAGTMMRVWDADTAKVINNFELDSTCALVRLSPDGETVAMSGESDRYVVLVGANGVEIGRLEGHQDVVSSIAFSSDGERVLTTDLSESIYVWNVQTRMRESIPESLGTSASFSPSDQWILAVHEDSGPTKKTRSHVQILDGKTFIRRSSFHMPSTDDPIVFSSDERRLLRMNGASVEIWDWQSGSLLTTLRPEAEEVSGRFGITVLPDDRGLVVVGRDRISLWPTRAQHARAFWRREDDSRQSP